MGKELISMGNFCLKLQQYKAVLDEMKNLTAEEIEQVSTIRICFSKNQETVEKDTALFINSQMNTFLEKISTLTKGVPPHTEDIYLTTDIERFQKRVLGQLKSLSNPEKFIQ